MSTVAANRIVVALHSRADIVSSFRETIQRRIQAIQRQLNAPSASEGEQKRFKASCETLVTNLGMKLGAIASAPEKLDGFGKFFSDELVTKLFDDPLLFGIVLEELELNVPRLDKIREMEESASRLTERLHDAYVDSPVIFKGQLVPYKYFSGSGRSVNWIDCEWGKTGMVSGIALLCWSAGPRHGDPPPNIIDEQGGPPFVDMVLEGPLKGGAETLIAGNVGKVLSNHSPTPATSLRVYRS